MSEIVTCTVKQAKELIKHLDENDMLTLVIINQKTHIHYGKPVRIEIKKGYELLKTL